jgi:hypothetical protein
VDSIVKRGGLTCWTYISSWNPANEYSRYIPEPDVHLRLQYPFIEYAVGYWHHHVKSSDAVGHDQTQLSLEIANFLRDSKLMRSWLQLSWPDYSDEARITPIHIAARAGFVSYVKQLLGSIDPDVQDAAGKTPL